MFFVIFPILTLLFVLLHLLVTSAYRAGWRAIAKIALRDMLVINVGLEGLFAFYGHAFMSAEVSRSIGWAPSPFEFEVAMANLAIGTLGILCWWFEGTFWLATIIATTVWLWGDAAGHLQQIAVAHDYAPNNAGGALYSDLILPVLLIALGMCVRASGRAAKAEL
jgi:hypothetical protein